MNSHLSWSLIHPSFPRCHYVNPIKILSVCIYAIRLDSLDIGSNKSNWKRISFHNLLICAEIERDAYSMSDYTTVQSSPF